MNIKNTLQESPLTRKLYKNLSKKKKEYQKKKKFQCTKEFINRSTESENLCLVLAGYKAYLYEAVFGRLKAFAPEDLDICIISSGIYSDDIAKICEKNNWSYLSTKENNVCLVQNAAISLFPKAKYIYKIDEDIFLTKGYFEKMKQAYFHAMNGEFRPGVIAPMIPLNGFSYFLLLKKLGLETVYEEKFGKPIFMAGNTQPIESDANVAKFFWGEGGYVPNIDSLNELVENQFVNEIACPIRFSIGAIMFERSFWELMGYYDVDLRNPGMGADESKVCDVCIENSRPIMISENIVVGHFSFGPQNDVMKKYYYDHRDKFSV